MSWFPYIDYAQSPILSMWQYFTPASNSMWGPMLFNAPLFQQSDSVFKYNPDAEGGNYFVLYLSDLPEIESNNKTSTTKKPNKTKTEQVHYSLYTPGSTETVDISTLNLSGTIASCNSKPRIAKENVQNLIELDKLLTSWGYEIVYTSCMGGTHCRNSGHYKGNKVDLQLRKNGKPARLTNEQLNKLKELGYWGKGTGAVGWESIAQQTGGGHYDICIA